MRPALLALTLAAGCYDLSSLHGDAAADAAAADSNPPVDAGDPVSACTHLATSICDRLSACSPGAVRWNWGTSGACVARLLGNFPSWFALPGLRALPTDVNACAAEVPKLTCDQLFEGDYRAVCKWVTGTLPDGAPCGQDLQCASGYCRAPSDKKCGTCGAPSKAGDSCAAVACPKSLFCASDQTCIAWGDIGSPCDKGHPCKPSLSCKGATAMSFGSCAMPLGPGAPCDATQVATPGCDNLQGLACVGAACTAVGFAKSNGACGAVNGTLVFCEASGFCRNPSPGVCIDAAADGRACDLVNGPGCLDPAVCENGVCVLFDPLACK